MAESIATVRITVVAPEQRCNYNCTCLDTDGSARNVETLGVLRDRMVRRLGFVDPLQDGEPRTLAALRRDLMIRLGHAASVDRPPPGMADLLDQIIAESEQQLWSRLELDRGDEAVPPRMSADTDTTTLSATLVFSQALGLAKAHYGKQDANLYLQQSEKQMQDYVRQSPPGVRATIDDFLREAQRFLYEKVASFRQSRFFEWELQEGVRFYDFHENADECHRKFVPELVEGVYVTNVPCPHERWQELRSGIDPILYNGGIRNGWPQRYEFRQCIEIFPAPDDRGGFLRIKAKSDLEPFEDDMHVTTIDADLVFMFALANAKAHFNQPDAQKYDQLAQSRLGEIIAGSHHTTRYIPVDGALPNANPPVPKDGWDY